MTKLDAKTARALMMDIVRWFKKLEKEYGLDFTNDAIAFYIQGRQYNERGKFVQCRKATSITQYGNDDSLTMTFEGLLYDILNDYFGNAELNWKLKAEFDKLFEKHRLYYELGHSWNLTACKA